MIISALILVMLALNSEALTTFGRPPPSQMQFCEKSWTTCTGTKAPAQFCSGDLIFEDQFDNFDFKKWKHEITLSGGGNWEFQWYTNNRSNSFVHNGKLYIKPTMTADTIGEENLSKMALDLNGGGPADYCTDQRFWGCSRTGTKENILNPIRSAKLTTVESFSFKYGNVQVRAKMPTGDWLWPAIWMVPRYNVYSTWPSSGEIDIAEVRGNEKLFKNGTNIGAEQVASTLHWGPNPGQNEYFRTHFVKNSPGDGYNKQFKTYEMEWTPDYLKFSVDGVELGTVEPQISFWDLGEFNNTRLDNPWRYGSKLAPFDEEFYFIFNLAVGGINFFPDDAVNAIKKPWNNKSPHAMSDFWNARESWLPTWNLGEDEGKNAALQIDWIKVWAL